MHSLVCYMALIQRNCRGAVATRGRYSFSQERLPLSPFSLGSASSAAAVPGQPLLCPWETECAPYGSALWWPPRVSALLATEQGTMFETADSSKLTRRRWDGKAVHPRVRSQSTEA